MGPFPGPPHAASERIWTPLVYSWRWRAGEGGDKCKVSVSTFANILQKKMHHIHSPPMPIPPCPYADAGTGSSGKEEDGLAVAAARWSRRAWRRWWGWRGGGGRRGGGGGEKDEEGMVVAAVPVRRKKAWRCRWRGEGGGNGGGGGGSGGSSEEEKGLTAVAARRRRRVWRQRQWRRGR